MPRRTVSSFARPAQRGAWFKRWRIAYSPFLFFPFFFPFFFSGDNVEEAFIQTARKIFENIQNGRCDFYLLMLMALTIMAASTLMLPRRASSKSRLSRLTRRRLPTSRPRAAVRARRAARYAFTLI